MFKITHFVYKLSKITPFVYKLSKIISFCPKLHTFVKNSSRYWNKTYPKYLLARNFQKLQLFFQNFPLLSKIVQNDPVLALPCYPFCSKLSHLSTNCLNLPPLCPKLCLFIRDSRYWNKTYLKYCLAQNFLKLQLFCPKSSPFVQKFSKMTPFCPITSSFLFRINPFVHKLSKIPPFCPNCTRLLTFFLYIETKCTPSTLLPKSFKNYNFLFKIISLCQKLSQIASFLPNHAIWFVQNYFVCLQIVQK